MESFYRIQAGWEYQFIDGFLQLYSLFSGKLLKISLPESSELKDVLHLLKLGMPTSEFDALIKTDATAVPLLLESLLKRGILIHTHQQALCEFSSSLFDRQVRFFNSFESSERSGAEIHEEFQNTHFAFIGLGSYGSWLLNSLARMGVKKITVADFDVVKESNLDSQILYRRRDLGRKKVDAAIDFIKEIHPACELVALDRKIETLDDLSEFSSAGFIFNTFGFVSGNESANHTSNLIAKFCYLKKIPFLVFSGSWIGPLCEADRGPCFFCFDHLLSGNWGNNSNNRSPLIQKRMFAPFVAMITNLAIWESVKYLIKLSQYGQLNYIKQFNLFSMDESKALKMPKSTRCNHDLYLK